MPNEMIDFAGDSDLDVSETSDLGGEDFESNSEESLDQSGGEPDSRVYDEEYVSDLRKQLSALNKQVVDYRRQANSNKPNPYQVNDGQSSDKQNYSYKQAMTLAKADLRDRVEGFLHLYPELPSDVANQIRRNPVAYVKGDFFDSFNVDNGALDVETWVANYVASTGNAGGKTPKAPKKQVNPNQVSTPDTRDNGSDNEPSENDWTMPIDQLEKKVRRLVANKNR